MLQYLGVISFIKYFKNWMLRLVLKVNASFSL